jgi:hypothetical protein
MSRTLLAAALIAASLTPASFAFARAGGHGHSYGYHSIPRSAEAKYEFKKMHPCPSTGSSHGACSGYVIDHVVPLKRGGADVPSNMQWQTVEEAKAKDKWE